MGRLEAYLVYYREERINKSLGWVSPMEYRRKLCCRGGFEIPNIEKTSRREETAYTGKHYVQCFVIRRGYCVRWSKPFFINVE